MLEARNTSAAGPAPRPSAAFHLNQGAHALYRGGAAWATLDRLRDHAPGRIRPTRPVRPRRARRRDARRAPGRRDGAPAHAPVRVAHQARGGPLTSGPTFEADRTTAPTAVDAGLDRHRSHDADPCAARAAESRVSTYCGDLDALDAARRRRAGRAGGGARRRLPRRRMAAARRRAASTSHGRAASRSARGQRSTPSNDAATGSSCAPRRRRLSTPTPWCTRSGGPRELDTLLHGASRGRARVGRARAPGARVDPRRRVARRCPCPSGASCSDSTSPCTSRCTRRTPRLVDGPGEVAHLLWYGDSADDPAPELEALLDRAQPGWRDEVVDIRSSRRLTVAHGRPLPGRGFAGRP